MPSERTFRVERVEWAVASALLSAVRSEVFIVEQSVPQDQELDELDPLCVHFLARDVSGAPIATGRLLPDGHIGRMAVLKAWRGCGVGSAVLDALLRLARERGDRTAILHAQTHARNFYARHGFVQTSSEFPEAGIPHIEMRLELQG
jgi:predicted GNAT family N-acyltransferase